MAKRNPLERSLKEKVHELWENPGVRKRVADTAKANLQHILKHKDLLGPADIRDLNSLIRTGDIVNLLIHSTCQRQCAIPVGRDLLKGMSKSLTKLGSLYRMLEKTGHPDFTRKDMPEKEVKAEIQESDFTAFRRAVRIADRKLDLGKPMVDWFLENGKRIIDDPKWRTISHASSYKVWSLMLHLLEHQPHPLLDISQERVLEMSKIPNISAIRGIRNEITKLFGRPKLSFPDVKPPEISRKQEKKKFNEILSFLLKNKDIYMHGDPRVAVRDLKDSAHAIIDSSAWDAVIEQFPHSSRHRALILLKSLFDHPLGIFRSYDFTGYKLGSIRFQNLRPHTAYLMNSRKLAEFKTIIEKAPRPDFTRSLNSIAMNCLIGRQEELDRVDKRALERLKAKIHEYLNELNRSTRKSGPSEGVGDRIGRKVDKFIKETKDESFVDSVLQRLATGPLEHPRFTWRVILNNSKSRKFMLARLREIWRKKPSEAKDIIERMGKGPVNNLLYETDVSGEFKEFLRKHRPKR